jgi:hypothetical protein
LETTPVAQKQWEFSIFEALDSLGSTKVEVFLEFSNLFKLSGEGGIPDRSIGIHELLVHADASGAHWSLEKKSL